MPARPESPAALPAVSPKGPTKEQLLDIMRGVAGDPSMPAVEPLKASEIVTFPALAVITSQQSERHANLVALINQRFDAAEKTAEAAALRAKEDRTDMKAEITSEGAKNDKRFVGTAITVALMALAALAKILLSH